MAWMQAILRLIVEKKYTEEYENDILFKTKELTAQFLLHITEHIMFSLILIYKILIVV